ncbi:MAG: hypothetical protein ACREND_18325, partial [Gemmatimonadaceae bacterium]
MPFSFEGSTLLYASVASQLGCLPVDVLSEVVLLYRDFELLNGAVERFHYFNQELRTTNSGV